MLQVQCMVNYLENFLLDVPGIIDAILVWKLNISKERLHAVALLRSPRGSV